MIRLEHRYLLHAALSAACAVGFFRESFFVDQDLARIIAAYAGMCGIMTLVWLRDALIARSLEKDLAGLRKQAYLLGSGWRCVSDPGRPPFFADRGKPLFFLDPLGEIEDGFLLDAAYELQCARDESMRHR